MPTMRFRTTLPMKAIVSRPGTPLLRLPPVVLPSGSVACAAGEERILFSNSRLRSCRSRRARRSWPLRCSVGSGNYRGSGFGRCRKRRGQPITGADDCFASLRNVPLAWGKLCRIARIGTGQTMIGVQHSRTYAPLRARQMLALCQRGVHRCPVAPRIDALEWPRVA